jgi:hypothetical protein
MSDESEDRPAEGEESREAKPFAFTVKASDLPELIGRVLEASIQTRASIEALAAILIVGLAKDDEAADRLLERYEKARAEGLLRLAFDLQDRPSAGIGGEAASK